MKTKLTLLLLYVALVTPSYADKKEDEGGDAPPPPPTNAKDEVENNPSPEDLLKEIEDLKAENNLLKDVRSTLITQRKEILRELTDTQEALKGTTEDYSNVKKGLGAAYAQINSLKEERSDLIKDLDEMDTILDRGPGSIFKGWVYSPKLKWMYVSPSIVPYAFSQDDGWVLYEYGTDPRRVYYYNTKEWKLLDNEK
jgi:hypothetical protein|tara:strand:- start:231 stop:821 length:591 start_codon:yes stop_codon:yes gene_type:complete